LLSITNLDRLELGTELGAKQKDNVLIEEAHSARGFGLTDDELDAQIEQLLSRGKAGGARASAATPLKKGIRSLTEFVRQAPMNPTSAIAGREGWPFWGRI
jgi:hypothetical protein